MKVFGRRIEIDRLFQVIFDFLLMIYKSSIFHYRLDLIIAYIKSKSPKTNLYILKNGLRIFLSSHPHDTICVAIIFLKNEYGKIMKGSVVLDIGANIGVFSLYAVNSGAKRIIAVEPNIESFNTLQKNIALNNLEDLIFPYNNAIDSSTGKIVKIPVSSSPYNKTVSSVDDPQCENVSVKTISMDYIFEDNKLDLVDFCKMDCEGAEYEAIFNMRVDNLKKIKSFRLENHDRGRIQELEDYFRNAGFNKTKHKNDTFWFENRFV